VDSHHLLRSELQATSWSRTMARYIAQMDAFARGRGHRADVGRRFEFLYGGGDYAGMANRGSRRALAWSSSRAESREPSRGIKKAGLVRLRRHRECGGCHPGPAIVFRQPLLFALRAIGRIGAESLAHADSEELRRVLTLHQTAPPSHVGAPAPIHRDKVMLPRGHD